MFLRAIISWGSADLYFRTCFLKECREITQKLRAAEHRDELELTTLGEKERLAGSRCPASFG